MGDTKTSNQEGDSLGLPVANVKRIVVIQPGGLSDIVWSIPALRHIRRTYFRAEVWVAGSKVAAELLKGCPYVDRIISIDACTDLKADIAISFANPDTYLKELESIKSELRVCWVKPKTAVSEHIQQQILWEANQDPVGRMVRLAWLLGGSDPNYELSLWPTLIDRNKAAQVLKGVQAPVVTMHLGDKDEAQEWQEAWKQAAAFLVDMGFSIVIVGQNEDALITGSEVGADDSTYRDLRGQTSVGVLAGVLERSQLFVGVCSGPSALAETLNISSLMLGDKDNPSCRSKCMEVIDRSSKDMHVQAECFLSSLSILAIRAMQQWKKLPI